MKTRLLCILWGIMIISFSNQVSGQETDNVIPYPFGVNLAGADFGKNYPGVYGKDYGYPSQKDIRYFKSKGLSLIRVPFRWERIQHELNGELDKDELARLKQVIQEAEKWQVQVIPDLHNYCRRRVGEKSFIIGQNGLSIENLADLWGKLAKELKIYSNIYGYGLINEPFDMLPFTPWTKIAQACIIAIRETDKKTPIIVGGDSWSSAERWMEYSDNLKNLYDPANRLIFEAHVYFDKDASGTYRHSYEEEGANPYTGVERVQPFIKWLKKNNFRGFIGEYGIPDNDERWLVCLENFLAYLSENKVNGTYWAAGPRWGNYPMSVQPTENYKKDRPQMKVLEKYGTTK